MPVYENASYLKEAGQILKEVRDGVPANKLPLLIKGPAKMSQTGWWVVVLLGILLFTTIFTILFATKEVGVEIAVGIPGVLYFLFWRRYKINRDTRKLVKDPAFSPWRNDIFLDEERLVHGFIGSVFSKTPTLSINYKDLKCVNITSIYRSVGKFGISFEFVKSDLTSCKVIGWEIKNVEEGVAFFSKLSLTGAPVYFQYAWKIFLPLAILETAGHKVPINFAEFCNDQYPNTLFTDITSNLKTVKEVALKLVSSLADAKKMEDVAYAELQLIDLSEDANSVHGFSGVLTAENLIVVLLDYSDPFMYEQGTIELYVIPRNKLIFRQEKVPVIHLEGVSSHVLEVIPAITDSEDLNKFVKMLS